MPTNSSSWLELAREVRNAKQQWQQRKLEHERAESELNYAQKALALAHERFWLMWHQHPEPEADGTASELDPEGLWQVLESVQFVGEPIGAACKSALRELKRATVERLVDYLAERGFQFVSEVPVREVHAALIKQWWAVKDHGPDEWVYQGD